MRFLFCFALVATLSLQNAVSAAARNDDDGDSDKRHHDDNIAVVETSGWPNLANMLNNNDDDLFHHHFGGAIAPTPVIGILSQPMRDRNETMVAASYVKWLEMGGARSVVIPYDAPYEMVAELYNAIDGVLFTGGGSDVPQAAKLLWKLIVDDAGNDEGKRGANLRSAHATKSSSSSTTTSGPSVMPIWGTCLGFEYLIQLATDNFVDMLEDGFDAENISLPLENVQQHWLYRGDMTKKLVSTKNVTLNNHHQGISPTKFMQNKPLTDKWIITSTNKDRNGREFVSTIEPHDPIAFPIFGVQYHPEKNAFEYGMNPDHPSVPYEAIDHSADGISAITMSQALYVAAFARLYHHKKQKMVESDDANLRTVVANTALMRPMYTYPIVAGTKFEQIYIIPPASELLSSNTNSAPVRMDDTDFERHSTATTTNNNKVATEM